MCLLGGDFRSTKFVCFSHYFTCCKILSVSKSPCLQRSLHFKPVLVERHSKDSYKSKIEYIFADHSLCSNELSVSLWFACKYELSCCRAWKKVEYQFSLQTSSSQISKMLSWFFHELYLPFHCWQKSDMLIIENKSFIEVENEINI